MSCLPQEKQLASEPAGSVCPNTIRRAEKKAQQDGTIGLFLHTRGHFSISEVLQVRRSCLVYVRGLARELCSRNVAGPVANCFRNALDVVGMQDQWILADAVTSRCSPRQCGGRLIGGCKISSSAHPRHPASSQVEGVSSAQLCRQARVCESGWRQLPHRWCIFFLELRISNGSVLHPPSIPALRRHDRSSGGLATASANPTECTAAGQAIWWRWRYARWWKSQSCSRWTVKSCPHWRRCCCAQQLAIQRYVLLTGLCRTHVTHRECSGWWSPGHQVHKVRRRWQGNLQRRQASSQDVQ